MARVFITGGTGYVGRRLVRALLELGYDVRVLTRQESSVRVPAGAAAVVGNALDAASFQDELNPGDTLVHLVGTPHPSPSKAAEFRRVDLPSILASVAAARHAGAAHVVYVSVAQPALVSASAIRWWRRSCVRWSIRRRRAGSRWWTSRVFVPPRRGDKLTLYLAGPTI